MSKKEGGRIREQIAGQAAEAASRREREKGIKSDAMQIAARTR